MTQELLVKKIKHSPTLNTIFMVEDVIKNADESIVSVAYIKKHLPRQVNHNTLMQILLCKPFSQIVSLLVSFCKEVARCFK